MMYIPLLKTIECLLQRDSIVDEVGSAFVMFEYASWGYIVVYD